MFLNGIYQTLPEVLTLYVVLCGEDGSGAIINEGTYFPQQLPQQTLQPFHQFFHQFQQQYTQETPQQYTQHFPQQNSQQYTQDFPQQYTQQNPQQYTQQNQQQMPYGDGRCILPDLNDPPTDAERLDWATKVKDDVQVAADILGIPLEDDGSTNDDHDHSNDEEVGIRNQHWGMPDPLPCPIMDIKPRNNMSYQPTSHVKPMQTFENKKAMKLAVGLKCVHENFQVKVKHSDKHRYEAVYIHENGVCMQLWSIMVYL